MRCLCCPPEAACNAKVVYLVCKTSVTFIAILLLLLNLSWKTGVIVICATYNIYIFTNSSMSISTGNISAKLKSLFNFCSMSAYKDVDFSMKHAELSVGSFR